MDVLTDVLTMFLNRTLLIRNHHANLKSTNMSKTTNRASRYTKRLTVKDRREDLNYRKASLFKSYLYKDNLVGVVL